MILALRTDKPEAELYLYEAENQLQKITWQAHRELSDTLLTKIDELLGLEAKRLSDLTGIVVYQGPGSFTGLRIGISVANTLAYSLKIPISAATNEDWLAEALKNLPAQAKPQIIMPEYGSEAHITAPRK
jgi:tRNA threonylcarbamoyladenosine biosynthesis protein TsaB